MNSSLRSKLFLITYGTILAFIAGLIIFNNTILRNYYTFRRNSHLIEAYEETKGVGIPSLETELAKIENEYNLSIQALLQDDPYDINLDQTTLFEDDDFYVRLYGNPYAINRENIIDIIYDYHNNQMENLDISRVVRTQPAGTKGYLFEVENTSGEDETHLIGFFVALPQGDGYLYYFNTITATSIDDNIWIFNSFTVIIGMFFMVLSAIVMYFISYRLTNPILEINRVANEISNLNFSDKAIVNTEDEIGQLAISVNKMSRELENTIEELKVSNQRLAEEILYKNQVEKMRKEFIVSASHELKTPLSLIMGYTEALKLEDLSKEDYDNYVDIITDETHKMNKLVREMLNISQIESGIISIQKEDFSIKELVESTLKLVSIKLNENDIKYEMDVEDVVIHSDYDQLQTVLINFINNAMNHIKEPKQLKIYSEKDKDKVRLLVFNTGQPILEEDISQLWDSFYKVDKARTRRYGGHGLGLSICRTIFEALNYNYGVFNLETGVAFYFDIKI